MTDLEILPRVGLVCHPGVLPLGPGPRSGFLMRKDTPQQEFAKNTLALKRVFFLFGKRFLRPMGTYIFCAPGLFFSL